MRKSFLNTAMLAAGAVVILASGAALASHGKAGLWEITMSMEGAHMPDLSKLPPEAQAAMRAHGISANGQTITIQHCMTAQEVALDTPPPVNSHGSTCAYSNMVHTSNHMSADMACTGRASMNGHIDVDWDSDEHYAAVVKITGTVDGNTVTNTRKMEGHYLSAQCGAVSH